MNLKKIKAIAVIDIFIISFAIHFMYEWFPNVSISILCPVNESIWEHMKILYSATTFYGIIDYILLRKYKIKYNNFMFQLFFMGFSSIVIYLIIYIPIYNLIGEHLIISISLMLIVYIICQIISYKILKGKEYKYINKVSILLIILMYCMFGYLTYKPLNNYIFVDNYVKEKSR